MMANRPCTSQVSRCTSASAPFSPRSTGWRKKGASKRVAATAGGGGNGPLCYRAALGTASDRSGLAACSRRGAHQRGVGRCGDGGSKVPEVAGRDREGEE